MKATHKEVDYNKISPIYTSLNVLWYVVPCSVMLKLVIKMLLIWKFGTLVQKVRNGNEFVSVVSKIAFSLLEEY